MVEQVAREDNTTIADILGPSRFPEHVRSRWRVFRMMRDRGASYDTIGRLMNRDHSTVRYALNKENPT